MKAAAVVVRLCADFTLFTDNTPFANQFVLAGYAFTKAPAGPAWFVNASGSSLGLQFPAAGGVARLPAPTPRVDLVVGTFAGPVTLQAHNAAGAVVATVTAPGTNSYAPFKLLGSGIVDVRFSGGGDEGVISRICTDYRLCEEPPGH